jgi:plastocyanin
VLAWTRDTGAVTVVSRSKAAADGASEDPSISADGRRVAFVSSATNLDARKADDSRAIFVRDRVAGTTRMVSDPLAAYPAGVVRRPAVKPVPVAAPAARADAPLARDAVLVVDNAFVHRGERPTLTVAPGTEVTWRWRSRESHGLTVRSGPEQFSAPAKNGADYRHRFTTPGTYRLACSLHAPGMRMTVVVTP